MGHLRVGAAVGNAVEARVGEASANFLLAPQRGFWGNVSAGDGDGRDGGEW